MLFIIVIGWKKKQTSNLILCGRKALLELRSLLIQIGLPSNSINIGTIPDTITELSSTFGPDSDPDVGGSDGGSDGSPEEGPEAASDTGTEGGPESEDSMANFLLCLVLPVILFY